MRKLATVRQIDDIKPIPNADAIECAVLGGWEVVVKKGEFSPGEKVLYLEVDSWVPHELAPFLTKGTTPPIFDGVRGNRLRTIKLRGQISQGLVLPVAFADQAIKAYCAREQANLSELPCFIDGDFGEVLNIKKFEKAIPASIESAKGYFPAFIRKTDQERIQNLSSELAQWIADKVGWEISEKLDGSSMTVYRQEQSWDVALEGVCSRNLDLKEDPHNVFWAAAIRQQLIEKIRQIGRNLAFQGELCGPGIQGNRYAFDEPTFFLFDIFDIDKQQYLRPIERLKLAVEYDIRHVPIPIPVVDIAKPIQLPKDTTPSSLLQMAEKSSSAFYPIDREGLVFKSACGQHSFKAISNKFLLKESKNG
jgi:RNA ligase (TIGR02306 family)